MKDEIKYSEKDVRTANFARALSHPARIMILRFLASGNNRCFYEISRELPLAGSTVTQHIAILKETELITAEYDPPNVKYSIVQGNWKLARKHIKKFMNLEIENKSKKTKK
jgi:DNA-binding transcriptional ArsR family regulator